MNPTTCKSCGLPIFHGPAGYAGPQCMCRWTNAAPRQPEGEVKHYWPEEIVGTGELVVYLNDYAALEAELATVKKVAYGNMELLEENAKLRAELERRVPDGFALVPVEPTPEMVSAAEEAHMPFGDMDIALRMAILSAPSAPATVPDAITMVEVMKAWEYAEDHPHKYLRGTTNWCAAVAHSLNQQRVAAPSAPKADDPVKQMLLEALEEILYAEIHSPISMNNAGCIKKMQGIARAAIAAARKGEGE